MLHLDEGSCLIQVPLPLDDRADANKIFVIRALARQIYQQQPYVRDDDDASASK